jgi:hypothetical protein
VGFRLNFLEVINEIPPKSAEQLFDFARIVMTGVAWAHALTSTPPVRAREGRRNCFRHFSPAISAHRFVDKAAFASRHSKRFRANSCESIPELMPHLVLKSNLLGGTAFNAFCTNSFAVVLALGIACLRSL